MAPADPGAHPLQAPRGGRGNRDDRPRRRRAARHGAPHARGAARRALGCALLVAVLPLDGDRRPAVARSARAALRHDVRRERGLRPLGAAPRRCRRRQRHRDALVLYRKHDAQASRRRAELQRECQRRVALRQIEALALRSGPTRAELAWRAGAGCRSSPGLPREAAEALAELVDGVRGSATAATRRGGRRPGRSSGRGRAATTERALVARPRSGSIRRCRRTVRRGCGGGAAAPASARPRRRWLARAARDEPVRLTLVIPEPTPFRTVMLDRVATRPELDLTVLYAGGTVQRRTWTIEPRHRAVFLEGRRVPGLYRALRHDYPVSLGIFRALAESRARGRRRSRAGARSPRRPPRRGAARAACRTCSSSRSNERDARPGWRRAVKGAVVPPILRGAARGARRRHARPRVDARARCRARTGSRCSRTRSTWRSSARRSTGCSRGARRCARRRASSPTTLPCSPSRGSRRRRGSTRSSGRLRMRAIRGSYWCSPAPGRSGSRSSPSRPGSASASFVLPDVPWERIVERFVLADVFALLSRHEPWGVVVNEAAACGLPLVVSDRVGAAFDLVEDGVNGALVPADDPVVGRCCDPCARRRFGASTGGGRGLARADAGLGLRAEHREPGPGRASRRGPSGARAPPRRSRAARRRRRPRSSGPPRGARRPRGVAATRRRRGRGRSPRRSPRCSYGTTSASPSANEAATPVRSETITGVPTAAASAATSPKFSPPEASTKTSARR